MIWCEFAHFVNKKNKTENCMYTLWTYETHKRWIDLDGEDLTSQWCIQAEKTVKKKEKKNKK